MIRFGDITIDRKNRRIYNGDRFHQYDHSNLNGHNNCRFRMTEMLLMSGGWTAKQLFGALYKHDPNGGPIAIQNTISVYLNQMSDVFEKLEFNLKAHKHNGYTVYRLVARS